MGDELTQKDDFGDTDTEADRTDQIDFDDIPEVMPLLPVRDVVIYSYMILPLMVGRERSIRAVEKSLSENRLIFLATQRVSTEEDPDPENIYDVGTVAMVVGDQTACACVGISCPLAYAAARFPLQTSLSPPL